MTLDELKKFCSHQGDLRYYLCEPWTKDGFTWASNGHILVRVPTIEGVLDHEKSPDGALLFNKQAAPNSWISVPNVLPPETEECAMCSGHKVHECDCGHEHTCGDCGGTGKQEDKVIGIAVGDAHFADKYLYMIRGWEIAVSVLNGRNNPAWIRNDDALGLLMPMRV